MSNKCIVSGKVTLLGGMHGKGLVRGLPLVLTREFQVGRLEVTVLRKAEAVISVGIRFCFADMGP